MGLESLAQLADGRIVTQMPHGLSGLVPNVFLWVQVRATRREVEHFQERMSFDELPDLAFVPGCSV